jgi:hypothetical protein
VRPLVVVGFLIACHRPELEAPELPVARPAVTPVAPTPPAKPVPAPRTTWTSIERRDNDTLCRRDAAGMENCRRMTMRGRGSTIGFEAPRPDDTALTSAGVACTYRGSTLACDGAAPITGVTAKAGGFYAYLHHGDTIRYFEPSHAAAPLSTMAPLPGGIRQLAIGFRVGCALTTDDAVWCWSDPKKPSRATTPPKVAEIMIQDPFELCVRTTGGDVHCSPPFVQDDSLICSKSQLACGTGTVEGPRPLKTSFDPLAKLMRPLRKLPLTTSVSRLSPDDDQLYLFCLDALAVAPDPIGGCTLSSTGEVSCFSVCKKAWRTGTVAGLPGGVTRIWSDDKTGYALAADGALWWWPRMLDCDAPANATAKPITGLPAISELAPTFSVQSGPQSWEVARCALTTAGDVRCWKPDPTTGTPANFFDP